MIESAEEFVKLRGSDKPEEYRRASNEPASEATWYQVLTNYPEMAFWVVQNKTVPPSILELLVDHLEPRVRCAVARKRKLSHKLFERLAYDEDESVRLTIALNKKVPAEILAKLRNDRSSIVVEAVIKRGGDNGS